MLNVLDMAVSLVQQTTLWTGSRCAITICVEVISDSKYQTKKEQGRQAATITQWDGYCLDNLGKIMLEFFKWASNIENLTRHMSICYSDMDIPNVPNKWFRKSMVIQDPFVLSKNVA